MCICNHIIDLFHYLRKIIISLFRYLGSLRISGSSSGSALNAKECYKNARKTCYEGDNDEFFVGKSMSVGVKRGADMDVNKCNEECNKVNECKFFTINIKSGGANACRMYTSCGIITESKNEGTTYSKDGKCPGIDYVPSIIMIRRKN